jgi:hypothetical protein
VELHNNQVGKALLLAFIPQVNAMTKDEIVKILVELHKEILDRVNNS